MLLCLNKTTFYFYWNLHYIHLDILTTLRCNKFILHFATVLWLFPWLRPEGGKTLRMLLRFMKAEYHLELIINCICLYVGQGKGCSS